jgi:hypothetical protein
MSEPHQCDADVLRCCGSITKLIFESAAYDAVKHLAGVHLHQTTKPEHANSRTQEPEFRGSLIHYTKPISIDFHFSI